MPSDRGPMHRQRTLFDFFVSFIRTSDSSIIVVQVIEEFSDPHIHALASLFRIHSTLDQRPGQHRVPAPNGEVQMIPVAPVVRRVKEVLVREPINSALRKNRGNDPHDTVEGGIDQGYPDKKVQMPFA